MDTAYVVKSIWIGVSKSSNGRYYSVIDCGNARFTTPKRETMREALADMLEKLNQTAAN